MRPKGSPSSSLRPRGARETVPSTFDGRNFYIHNPQVTLMRTTPDECRQLGKILADKAATYTAPVSIMIPKKAISVISIEGQPFYDAAADEALFSAIHEHATVPVHDFDCGINDRAFAEACVETLLQHINQ